MIFFSLFKHSNFSQERKYFKMAVHFSLSEVDLVLVYGELRYHAAVSGNEHLTMSIEKNIPNGFLKISCTGDVAIFPRPLPSSRSPPLAPNSQAVKTFTNRTL